jgi:hypothetical protein
MPKSNEGNILRSIIKILKENDFETYLIDHIVTDKNINGNNKNSIALKSDQAETPQEIFEAIYKRTGIPKSYFFDPCIYLEKWSENINYNGLYEKWLGNFHFCNPPFSIGSRFISKAILEFIRGKNIILLLP